MSLFRCVAFNHRQMSHGHVSAAQSGFTLFELLIGLAITAILASLAAPSFSNMINRQKINSAANNLLAAAMYARNESATRSANIVMCVADSTGSACDTTNKWQQGVVIFVDSNANGALDTGETIVRVVGRVGRNVVIMNGPNGKVQFRPYGGLAAAVTFTVCTAGISEGKEIKVPRFGLPATSVVTVTSCV